MNLVFFDADDTLWEIKKHYKGAMGDISQQLAMQYKVNANDVRQIMERISVEVRERLGCGRHSFPTIVVKTLVEIAIKEDIPITSDDILAVYRIADEIHDQVPELKPGVASTISELNRKGYICKILTLGDRVIQSSKIYQSGIWEYINESIIVSEKNEETYRNIMKRFSDSSNFIMVGNSIEKDVTPALRAGWHCIHVPTGERQSEQGRVVNPEEKRFFGVENIKEAAQIIRDICEN